MTLFGPSVDLGVIIFYPGCQLDWIWNQLRGMTLGGSGKVFPGGGGKRVPLTVGSIFWWWPRYKDVWRKVWFGLPPFTPCWRVHLPNCCGFFSLALWTEARCSLGIPQAFGARLGLLRHLELWTGHLTGSYTTIIRLSSSYPVSQSNKSWGTQHLHGGVVQHRCTYIWDKILKYINF